MIPLIDIIDKDGLQRKVEVKTIIFDENSIILKTVVHSYRSGAEVPATEVKVYYPDLVVDNSTSVDAQGELTSHDNPDKIGQYDFIYESFKAGISIIIKGVQAAALKGRCD